MVWIKLLITAVCGYMLGNISTGIILADRLAKIDIRERGSKSSGATNMFRVLGAKASALTLIGDALKGTLAALIGLLLLGRDGLTLFGVYLEGPIGAYVGGLCAVIGHMWPVVYKFHGGKGVSTCLGAALVIGPAVGLILFALWFLIVYFTQIVSIASLLSILLYALYYVIFHWGQWPLCVYAVLIAALIYFGHRSNIVRILNGTEKNNRVNLFEKK